MTLTGQAAFVTGGSRGIGRAIARGLAEAGADVAITYQRSAEQARSVVDEITAMGLRGLALRAENADPDAVAGAVHRAAGEFGRLDVLVNNAGIFPVAKIDEVSVAEIDTTLAAHVRAVLVASQAAIRHMGAGGRIISIGSSLAERVPYPGVSLYSASKAALVGLTRGLARDLGERGITAVLVNAGSTDTEMNPADGPDGAAERALTALGRYNAPEDIAATVVHLAGPAGANITGTTITIDAGASA
ncbi:SDR family NAD(P)-dependent oxidoreductase [Pseudonocardia acaciae]|uniref:SDR family NAD(P)-dependent oxidoreductase n=1 Tax=Pseudonocardia acaciae TaxID=551276 RepID=UPI00048ED2E5|nr:SDR family NAD(P)-dependent oxidoreductase [Pseudonocardia acaciae]